MDTQSSNPAPNLVTLGPSEDALHYVLDFVDKSEQYRRRYADIWDEVLANYMVSFDTNGGNTTYAWNWNNRINGVASRVPGLRGRINVGSRLKDPETHQIVETLSAQAISLALGQRDYIQAVPIGMDDPEKARLLSRLLMGVLESPNFFMSNYLGFKDSFIFGTAIMELGWERCQRMQMTQMGPQPVTYRDGPLLRNVDIYDFYPDPSGTRIQHDMVGVAKRFRISRAQASELSRQGVYDPTKTELIILRAKAKLNVQNSGTGDTRFPSDQKQVGKDTGVLEGFEYWGRVPYATQDGADNRVITVLEGEVVRDTINPYFDGMIPFKEIVVNPIAGRFYGLGPAEVIRFMQDSADNMLMLFNDAADSAVHAPLLVGSAFGGDPNRLRNRAPLDIIPCANPDSVAPVPVDLNALQFASQDLMRRKMTMREAGGATNPSQSIASSDRQTATEISTLAQAASQRSELMVQIYERDYLSWLGKAIHYRVRQYGSPQMVATLEGEPFMVRMEDIDYEADVRFVGSLHAKSKMQRASEWQQALTVLSQPDLVLMFPDPVMQYLRDVLDIKDAPMIVQRAVQQLQMKMLIETMQNVASNDQSEEAGPASQPKNKEENMGTESGQTEKQGAAVS